MLWFHSLIVNKILKSLLMSLTFLTIFSCVSNYILLMDYDCLALGVQLYIYICMQAYLLYFRKLFIYLTTKLNLPQSLVSNDFS